MSTRKIKDAKDLVTNELIYFKGHARATFMSDGKTVEEAINGINNGGGGIIAETDPIFSASPAASITEAKKAEWDNKMDKVTLAKVATSGSYNDLSNKPTIPAAVTETTVKGWGFAKSADLEVKEDKPIIFDVDAANITLGDGGDIDGSFTAAQLQAATGMAPADFTAAILSGRRVCVSLYQGTIKLLQVAYILDESGIQLAFSDGMGSIIVVLQVGYSSGEGSINQGSVFSFFYTKDEVNYLIASAITSTLNTAV